MSSRLGVSAQNEKVNAVNDFFGIAPAAGAIARTGKKKKKA